MIHKCRHSEHQHASQINYGEVIRGTNARKFANMCSTVYIWVLLWIMNLGVIEWIAYTMQVPNQKTWPYSRSWGRKSATTEAKHGVKGFSPMSPQCLTSARVLEKSRCYNFWTHFTVTTKLKWFHALTSFLFFILKTFSSSHKFWNAGSIRSCWLEFII